MIFAYGGFFLKHACLRTNYRRYGTGATREGTAQYFSEVNQSKLKVSNQAKDIYSIEKSDGIKPFLSPIIKKTVSNRTGWTLSSIGMSTYGMSSRSSQNLASIEKAIISGGVNVLETSPNYGSSETEEQIAIALQRIFQSEYISREQIVIVSKMGPIVTEEALDEIERRKKSGSPFDQVFFPREKIGYCISPDYLEYQISRSLEKLQLNCIDILIIDHPEVVLPEFLNDQDLFYIALGRAMKHLEKEARRGRIQYYGLSASKWNFSSISPTEYDYGSGWGTVLTSVSHPSINWNDFITMLHGLGANNRFSALEYPYNLMEFSTVFDLVSKESDSTCWKLIPKSSNLHIEAHKFDWIQFTCRPINALLETAHLLDIPPLSSKELDSIRGIMYQLVFPEECEDGHLISNKLTSAFNFCIQLEKSYAEQVSSYFSEQGDNLDSSDDSTKSSKSTPPHPQNLCWGQLIASNGSKLDLETFRFVAEYQIKPLVKRSIDIINKDYPQFQTWAKIYSDMVDSVCTYYLSMLVHNRYQELKELSDDLNLVSPDLANNKSLPSKAVRFALSSYATTVFVGMNSVSDVIDILYGGSTPDKPMPMTPIKECELEKIFHCAAQHHMRVRESINESIANEKRVIQPSTGIVIQ